MMKDIKRFVVLYSAFLIYSLSAVCAKAAAQQGLFVKAFLFLCLEMGCLGIYALIWQQALKRFPLVTAMAHKGVVVVFNLFWSVLIFQEKVTVCNVAGAVVIICGICVVSSEH